MPVNPDNAGLTLAMTEPQQLGLVLRHRGSGNFNLAIALTNIVGVELILRRDTVSTTIRGTRGQTWAYRNAFRSPYGVSLMMVVRRFRIFG